MGWESLGSVTVSHEWESFPTDIIGSETVRILQNYNALPAGYLYVSQYFPTPGGRNGFRRVYPDALPVIIDLPIPITLKEQGQVLRTVQIRHTLPEYASLVWSVELQALY